MEAEKVLSAALPTRCEGPCAVKATSIPLAGCMVQAHTAGIACRLKSHDSNLRGRLALDSPHDVYRVDHDQGDIGYFFRNNFVDVWENNKVKKNVKFIERAKSKCAKHNKEGADSPTSASSSPAHTRHTPLTRDIHLHLHQPKYLPTTYDPTNYF